MRFYFILLFALPILIQAQIKVSGIKVKIDNGVGIATADMIINEEGYLDGGGQLLLTADLIHENSSLLNNNVKIEFKGGNAQNIFSSNGIGFKELKLSNQQNLLVNNDLFIDDVLDFQDGSILMSLNSEVELGYQSKVLNSGVSKFVDGKIFRTVEKYESFNFPTGKYGYGYFPVRIINSNEDNEFSVLFHEGAQNLGHSVSSDITSLSDSEYWTIESEDPISDEIKIDFQWYRSTDETQGFNSVSVARYNSVKWLGNEPISRFGNTNIGQVGIGAISFLGEFCLVNSTGIIIDFSNTSVFDLNNGIDHQRYFPQEHLGFRYRTLYKQPEAPKLSFKILDNQNNIVWSNSNEVIEVDKINGIYVISCLNTKLPIEGDYILEVTDEKNYKQYLKFNYSGLSNCE